MNVFRRHLLYSFLVLGALLFLPAAARAHHILGLPHYAYDDRYPQAPVLTYLVETGAYEVKMTGYPGKPQPGERCELHVYIKHKKSGRPFEGKVVFSAVRDSLMGRDPVIYGPVEGALEQAVYKFYPRFEEEANYIMRIEFEAEGELWVIDLPMAAGRPGSPWIVLGSVVGGLAALLVVVRAIRIKQRRKRQGPVPALPEGELD